MPAFLDDITPFYGTVEKNKKGETLEDLRLHAMILIIMNSPV